MILKNAVIYLENGEVINGSLKIKNGLIDSHSSNNEEDGLDLQGMIVIPGFIDTHIHGGYGSDMMDATIKDLNNISLNIASEGTTSFYGTSITQDDINLNKALEVASTYILEKDFPGAILEGIHLEGPFINKDFKGAQPLEYIKDGSVDEFKVFMDSSKNSIKIVTLAAEKDKDNKLVKYLTKNQIIPSCGHSGATADEMKIAIENGLSRITHIFNASSKIHHRDVGVAGYGLIKDGVKVEVICDLYHLGAEAVNLVYKTKPIEDIILISDSMRAKGLPDGNYELGGQTVVVKDNKCRLQDGTIAGSSLKYNEGLFNFKNTTNCSIHELIKISSTNAAKELGIFDRVGSIKKGKQANLVVLDDDFNVYLTIVNGELVFKNKKFKEVER